MFQVGDKVIIDSAGPAPTTGYIVSITIDPLTENEVEFEAKEWIDYVIRVYNKCSPDGYYDFRRDSASIRKVCEYE